MSKDSSSSSSSNIHIAIGRYISPLPLMKHDTTLKKDIWILGSKYDSNSHDNDIKDHCKSFMRYTYRRDLPCLSPYNYNSDQGWGCMIRVCQMLMASAYKHHYLGKDWRLPSNIELSPNSKEYKEILTWFVDYTGPPHFYSIHHMVRFLPQLPQLRLRLLLILLLLIRYKQLNDMMYYLVNGTDLLQEH